MNCRERGSHARGVYLTQDTSRMGKVRMKQEEEANKNNRKKNRMKYGRNYVGAVMGKGPKQGLTSAIMLLERRESP